MMMRGECLEWVVVMYRSWSTVPKNLVRMEGSKPVVVRIEGVARGVDRGDCESGHCSKSHCDARRDAEDCC